MIGEEVALLEKWIEIGAPWPGKDTELIQRKDSDKITDEDYQVLHARLTARAVEIMKRRDELEARDREKQRSKTIRHPSAQPHPKGSGPA